MNHIAPTDVTDPPDGWGWAMREVTLMNRKTGECKYVVRQQTPTGLRHGGEPMAGDEAAALMRKWNEEAKQ